MRITAKKRQENIESVFKAVIDLSKSDGFDALTMKAIAKRAGIGEATIYNYFPQKEFLVSGYLDWTLSTAIDRTKTEISRSEMSLSDAIHILLESHIEVLSEGKEFFREAVRALFASPMSLSSSSLSSIRAKHHDFTEQQMDLAVGRGEFPEPAFKAFLTAILWDYHIGVLYYWLNDDSEATLRTTELIDLSLKLFEQVLKSDLLNRAYGVAHFLFKEHILNHLLNPNRA